LKNTIGFFSGALYLRVSLSETDTFADLTRRVVDEFCQASEHADFSYLRSRMPQPEFTRTTAFNWLPPSGETQVAAPDLSGCGISLEPIAYELPKIIDVQIDNEPSIMLTDTGEEIVCDIFYPSNRMSRQTMQRFGRGLETLLNVAVMMPHTRVSTVSVFDCSSLRGG
jgi:hypothetical protein